MKRKTTSVAAVLGAILGASALWGPAAAGPAHVPAPGQLMALAFPGWTDSAGGRLQSVTLPRGGRTHAGWSADAARVLAEPGLVLRTDATHLTLVAGLLPAGEDGKPAVSKLTPMALAAYQFELRGDLWQVAARQGIFAWRGFAGAATLRAVALSSQRQGLGVEYGGCWDGYCGTWIALYELNRGMVRRQPAIELALSGNNVEGAADCARRLQALLRGRSPDTPARDDGAASDTHDCYAVEGNWAVDPAREQPGDLVIHYQGAISRADAHAAPPVAIDQKQVLRYGSGKYRAVSGFNPVPPI